MPYPGTISKVADDLQDALLTLGFIVHRYDAHSTNSVYLKLDCGLCNSIRISDHGGKKKLSYRYNVIMNCEKIHIDKSGKYPRRFYPVSKIKGMIMHIVEARENKIRRYGLEGYGHKVEEYRRAGAREKGFWQKAREVKV